MTKYCPIMSYQKQYSDERNCMEEVCAFWDEERGQCCLKSAALAVAGKKSGGFNPPASDFAVFPPVSISPAHIPNSSGDWIDPHPYRINCNDYVYNGERITETPKSASDYVFNGGL